MPGSDRVAGPARRETPSWPELEPDHAPNTLEIGAAGRGAADDGIGQAIALGRRILEDWFANDPGLFEAAASHPAGLRDLAARRAPGLAAARARESVRLWMQWQQLRHGTRERLSLTHHRALLGLPGQDEKRQLAELCIDQRWTARELFTAVRHRLASLSPRAREQRRRGRPPVSRCTLAIRALAAATAAVRDVAGNPKLARGLGVAECRVLEDALDEALDELAECFELVRRAAADEPRASAPMLAGSGRPAREKAAARPG